MEPDKNAIIGDLLTKEKYKFIDPKLIAAIATDTLELAHLQSVTTMTVPEKRKTKRFQCVAFERL